MSKGNTVYKELEQILLSKRFNEGDKFFSEHQMMTKYKVSRLTVRNILKKLESTHFLKSKQGVGYFVNNEKFWNKGGSWNKRNDGTKSSTVLNCDIPLDDFFVKKLNLHKNNYFSYLKVRKINDIVSHYSLIWINKSLVGELKDSEIEYSTIQLLRKKNDFDCSLNILKMSPITDLDCEIIGKIPENIIPIKYSSVQNKEMMYIQLSIERYNPKYFEHYFIQNL